MINRKIGDTSAIMQDITPGNATIVSASEIGKSIVNTESTNNENDIALVLLSLNNNVRNNNNNNYSNDSNNNNNFINDPIESSINEVSNNNNNNNNNNNISIQQYTNNNGNNNITYEEKKKGFIPAHATEADVVIINGKVLTETDTHYIKEVKENSGKRRHIFYFMPNGTDNHGPEIEVLKFKTWYDKHSKAKKYDNTKQSTLTKKPSWKDKQEGFIPADAKKADVIMVNGKILTKADTNYIVKVEIGGQKKHIYYYMPGGINDNASPKIEVVTFKHWHTLKTRANKKNNIINNDPTPEEKSKGFIPAHATEADVIIINGKVLTEKDTDYIKEVKENSGKRRHIFYYMPNGTNNPGTPEIEVLKFKTWYTHESKKQRSIDAARVINNSDVTEVPITNINNVPNHDINNNNYTPSITENAQLRPGVAVNIPWKFTIYYKDGQQQPTDSNNNNDNHNEINAPEPN